MERMDANFALDICESIVSELDDMYPEVIVDFKYNERARSSHMAGRVDSEKIRFMYIKLGGKSARYNYEQGFIEYSSIKEIVRTFTGEQYSLTPVSGGASGGLFETIKGYRALLMIMLHEFAHCLQHADWLDDYKLRFGHNGRSHGSEFKKAYIGLINNHYEYFIEEYDL